MGGRIIAALIVSIGIYLYQKTVLFIQEKKLKNHPDNIKLIKKVALRYYKSDKQKTFLLLEKILHIDNNEPFANYVIGLNNYKLKNYGIAKKQLEQYINGENDEKLLSKSDQKEALYYLGHIYYIEGDIDKANTCKALSSTDYPTIKKRKLY